MPYYPEFYFFEDPVLAPTAADFDLVMTSHASSSYAPPTPKFSQADDFVFGEDEDDDFDLFATAKGDERCVFLSRCAASTSREAVGF